MFKVKEDIEKAREVIDSRGRYFTLFNDKSFIYKSTNENIRDIVYRALLTDKENVLSVIGSGDQILNTILHNSTNIDAFDISRFPKYFLEFKIAAIKCLNYEEFCKLFYGKSRFDNNLFKKVMNSIDREEVKEFWDGLCSTNIFDRDKKMSPRRIYDSLLFDQSTKFESATIPVERVFNYNPYLDEDCYYVLKKKLQSGVNINYFTGDIKKLVKNRDKQYDLVNLSNICMYGADMQAFTEESNYKKLVTSFNLRDNGKVLSYLMGYAPGSLTSRFYEKFFKDDENFDIHKVQTVDGYPDALLVYRKVR